MERRVRSPLAWQLSAASILLACGGESSSPPTEPSCTGLGLFTLALERAVIEVGETTQATVIARGCGGIAVSTASLTWESSNPQVAVVGQKGAITGRSVGAAQISAKLFGSVAPAALAVTEPRDPPMPMPGSLAVQIFSPTTGAIVDDSIRVLASVSPQGPLARVVGAVGAREFTLSSIPVGAFGGGEAWEARLRVNDLAAGNYTVVVRAFSLAGASTADSVIFERRLLNTGGTGTGPSGNKLRASPQRRGGGP